MTRVKAQTTVFPFCSPSPPLSLLLFIHFLHLPIPIANKNITYIHTYKMNNNFRVTRTPEETPTTSSTFLNPIQVSSLFVNFPFYFLNFFFFWGTLAVFSRVTDGMKDANFFFFFGKKKICSRFACLICNGEYSDIRNNSFFIFSFLFTRRRFHNLLYLNPLMI